MACGTRGIGVEHAGGGIAARVGTVVSQATVTLLARLHKAIPTHRGVKQAGRLVAQTVVHRTLKGQCQVLIAAAAPVGGALGPVGREQTLAVGRR